MSTRFGCDNGKMLFCGFLYLLLQCWAVAYRQKDLHKMIVEDEQQRNWLLCPAKLVEVPFRVISALSTFNLTSASSGEKSSSIGMQAQTSHINSALGAYPRL